MNIETFEKHIDRKQGLKGKANFEGGCIVELEETDPGKWEGIVAGSDDYKEIVSLVKKQIEDCSWDENVAKYRNYHIQGIYSLN